LGKNFFRGVINYRFLSDLPVKDIQSQIMDLIKGGESAAGTHGTAGGVNLSKLKGTIFRLSYCLT